MAWIKPHTLLQHRRATMMDRPPAPLREFTHAQYTPRGKTKSLESVPIDQCLNCPLEECRATMAGKCPLTNPREHP